jgi:hypothetical protein
LGTVRASLSLYLPVLLAVAAACRGEEKGTCEQAAKRLSELDSAATFELCGKDAPSKEELACMVKAPDLVGFWHCEWEHPAARADLQEAYATVLPAALAKVKEAKDLRRHFHETGDTALLRSSLPLLTDAATTIRGFAAKSAKVRRTLAEMADAVETYRDAIAASADAIDRGDQAALDAANQRIEQTMEAVGRAEGEFHEGMVATGMRSK